MWIELLLDLAFGVICGFIAIVICKLIKWLP